ncbi:hypothetical protein [Enterobacter huaxiensis]|jgi:hypothetical protein|uniref:hypothetical protein n=1 Tax=Enterobacter huaxiensis TaxID=2494702 RepID=UPI000E718993|nr:hypothetical protein [Enterobacter huaxiensis]UNC52206.1 hypothetical protein D5067_0022465 [Enterobacter huaxiensis]
MRVFHKSKLLVLTLPMVVSGCAGMINDFNNMTVERISYPAKLHRTLDCLETAAMNHGYSLKDTGDKIGDAHRYELHKNGIEKYITLDISGNGKNTDIEAIYDRREVGLLTGYDGVIGYCKREVG